MNARTLLNVTLQYIACLFMNIVTTSNNLSIPWMSPINQIYVKFRIYVFIKKFGPNILLQLTAHQTSTQYYEDNVQQNAVFFLHSIIDC